jgi:oxaloacetate decarboxylase alpha subunit
VANYSVAVDGKVYQVQVAAGETQIQPVQAPAAAPVSASAATPLQAGLAGTVNKVLVTPGEQVVAGQTVMILEAMKMETEVSAMTAGSVAEVLVRQGDAVVVGQNLLTIAEV